MKYKHIYTHTGDHGTTKTLRGKTVSKGSDEIFLMSLLDASRVSIANLLNYCDALRKEENCNFDENEESFNLLQLIEREVYPQLMGVLSWGSFSNFPTYINIDSTKLKEKINDPMEQLISKIGGTVDSIQSNNPTSNDVFSKGWMSYRFSITFHAATVSLRQAESLWVRFWKDNIDSISSFEESENLYRETLRFFNIISKWIYIWGVLTFWKLFEYGREENNKEENTEN